jgi:transcriptional regulator with XRE-family HTH domain
MVAKKKEDHRRRRRKRLGRHPEGLRARLIRMSKGLDQQDAAERMGISSSTLCRIEQGTSPLLYCTAVQMALVYMVDLASFDTVLGGPLRDVARPLLPPEPPEGTSEGPAS